MAISADYITLQRQVADELGNRTDLLEPLSDSSLTLSPIQNAIQSAIAKWEREPFYFNEVWSQNLFNTVSGTELYTTSGEAANLLANSPDLLRLHIKISNNRYPLRARSWQYIEDVSPSTTATGEPSDYAYLDKSLRLYPIPNGAYPITIGGTERLVALSATTDANCWTQDAYDLIRSEAKLIVAREVLHDDELALRMELAIYGASSAGGAMGKVPNARGYLSVLKGESTRRARSRIRPTQF